jgi:hypothetical protein
LSSFDGGCSRVVLRLLVVVVDDVIRVSTAAAYFLG